MRTPSFQPSLSRRLRIFAEVSEQALRNNYHVILNLAKGQKILPMIKADAYGHGMLGVARTLIDQDELYGFGVATLDEGLALRKGLGDKARVCILVVSGAVPWSEELGAVFEKHSLTPLITRLEDLRAFLKQGWGSRITYEIKFNTGMNRLGIRFEDLSQIRALYKDRPALEFPKSVMSHLASSDDPNCQASQEQMKKFRVIRREMGALFPRAFFHLANSGGIWKAQEWSLEELTDVVRPGISLYGIPPWKGAPTYGLMQAMKVQIPVISIHDLKSGDKVGYNGTYKVKGKERIAILAGGYGDGISRALSNQGAVLLNGKLESINGRVSMDLTSIGCSNAAKVGDRALFIGGELDIWRHAEKEQTIPYELLTSLTNRVQRIYVPKF